MVHVGTAKSTSCEFINRSFQKHSSGRVKEEDKDEEENDDDGGDADEDDDNENYNDDPVFYDYDHYLH